MASTVNRLTAIKVQKLKEPGMHPDGAGLYLQVTGPAAKSWVLRYSVGGKAREMGLGTLRKVSLAEARRKAADCHKLLEDHIDPIKERERRRAAAVFASTKTITFTKAADKYCASHRAGLKNLKHAAQWRTTLATYVEPDMGKLLVCDIDTGLVHRVLEKIWTSKPETASRVRGRIESVLDWAKVNKYRDGENPARWRGNLDKLLPKRSKVRKVKHHAALPYAELPAFMQKLRKERGTAARALEFCILTAARTGETLKARPNEISHKEKLWAVPAERMKGGLEHRVPLCHRALEIIDNGSKSYLFPSQYHDDKHLSDMAMLNLLERIGHGDITLNGLRSSFKEWARDRTGFENYVVESALAHAVGDKVEAAYARSDVIDKRRKLMQAWADYCASTPAPASKNVVPMRSA
jgi:integrase